MNNIRRTKTANTAGGSGAFGDDGRHAPAPCCLQVNVERANERPGIWRPLRKRKSWSEACRMVCALST